MVERNLVQVDLRDHLVQMKSLTWDEPSKGTIKGAILGSPMTGYNKIRILDSGAYSGELKDVVLVHKKYFARLDCEEIICSGLTHSDYFINWPGFDESGMGKSRELVRNKTKIMVSTECASEIEDECIFIGGDTIVEPNWAHWFFEHLLKLRIMQQAEKNFNLPVVVSDRIPTRFLKWGEWLLASHINWKQINISSPVKFKRVHVASVPAYRDKLMIPNIWLSGFNYLRANGEMTSQITRATALPALKVGFISRRNSSWRRAVNEETLLQITQRIFGSAVLLPDMSALTLQDQIHIWSDLDIVVMFAGADGPMSNFMKPTATLVELTAPNHVAMYSSSIFCAIHSLRQIRVQGEPISNSTQTGPNVLDVDYYVDENKYLSVMNALSKLYGEN